MSNQYTLRDSYVITNKMHFMITDYVDGEIETTIHERNAIIKVPLSASKIIRSTGKLFGHTLQSLTNQSKVFFGKDLHKLPICISSNYKGPCIIFPLFSLRTTSNIWINANAIVNIRQKEHETILTFKGGKEVVLPYQYLGFCSQYSRSIIYSNYLATSVHI